METVNWMHLTEHKEMSLEKNEIEEKMKWRNKWACSRDRLWEMNR